MIDGKALENPVFELSSTAKNLVLDKIFKDNWNILEMKACLYLLCSEVMENTKLIDAIETLGSIVCSGDCAKIVLEYCDSGLYDIEEYDGYETLITPDDEREWIKIEEEVDEN